MKRLGCRYSVLKCDDAAGRVPHAYTEIYSLLQNICELSKTDRMYKLDCSTVCFLDKLSVEKADRKIHVNGAFGIVRGEVQVSCGFELDIITKVWGAKTILILEDNADGLTIDQFLNYLMSFAADFASAKGRKLVYTLRCEVANG